MSVTLNLGFHDPARVVETLREAARRYPSRFAAAPDDVEGEARYHAEALRMIAEQIAEQTRPEPEEPQTYGAVIRDDDGELWARTKAEGWVSLTDPDLIYTWDRLVEDFGPLEPTDAKGNE